jgi:hypothetical protein
MLVTQIEKQYGQSPGLAPNLRPKLSKRSVFSVILWLLQRHLNRLVTVESSQFNIWTLF